MRTESEIQQDIKKLYAEREKIRKAVYAQYVGKCYLVNATFYFIESVRDKGFNVIAITDLGVSYTIMHIELGQLVEYEVTKEKFIQELEKRVDLIIKQVKGE